MPDGTRTMELAAYEQKRRKAAAAALAPVDSEALARTILQKAGGTPADAGGRRSAAAPSR